MYRQVQEEALRNVFDAKYKSRQEKKAKALTGADTQGSGKSALGAFFDISPRCKGIGYLSLVNLDPVDDDGDDHNDHD
eukprot:316006-Hanusia_phi.AAC.2